MQNDADQQVFRLNVMFMSCPQLALGWNNVIYYIQTLITFPAAITCS